MSGMRGLHPDKTQDFFSVTSPLLRKDNGGHLRAADASVPAAPVQITAMALYILATEPPHLNVNSARALVPQQVVICI